MNYPLGAGIVASRVTMPNPDTSRRLLLVTNRLQPSPQGGRELLCRLNHDALRATLGNRLCLYELPKRKLAGLVALLGAFRGWIDGLDAVAVRDILDLIAARSIAEVFIDGSNLGTLAAIIKASRPEVRVTTFFHNVEARFFWGSLRLRKSPRALAVLLVNYLAERRAVRCSDRRICLSERDSGQLRRLYGRGATHLSPMAMEDKLPADFRSLQAEPSEPYALFVGGAFYANREGIRWFVERVVPRIRLKVCIVGRGFEDLRDRLTVPARVEVIGAVEDLAPWYLNARLVIAPIFDGSGMKTKVAEALMFGKAVLGTVEAFSGYEEIIGKAGQVCDTADQFVAAIGHGAWERTGCDPTLRALFVQRYSRDALCLRYRGLFDT